MGRKQYNELNGGDKEGSCSNQGDFTQKFGLDLRMNIGIYIFGIA
ncbi:hypothetical protein [Caldanaerobacter subterraneus]|nr:hypothetical protein [Caldanaerobacter subterraneus]